MHSIWVPGDARFVELIEEVAHALRAQNALLATAESCTGGWIAKCCTDLAGSSAWFERGFVAYSYEAKQSLLGVSAASILNDGAVSRNVAIEMAEGALERAGTAVALSVTGIAGPGGGTEEKPVGTVWFGWAREGHETLANVMHFDGDRDSIRRQTVGYSLKELHRLLTT